MTWWAFDELDMVAIELTTKIGNVASERVAQKAGFHLVEILDQYAYPQVPSGRFQLSVGCPPLA